MQDAVNAYNDCSILPLIKKTAHLQATDNIVYSEVWNIPGGWSKNPRPLTILLLEKMT